MSKHTKGPWEYLPGNGSECGAITSKTGWVCDFFDDPSPEDARLIAAAPELLEALEEALPMLHTSDELPMSYYKDKPGALGKALRAIEKAHKISDEC